MIGNILNLALFNCLTDLGTCGDIEGRNLNLLIRLVYHLHFGVDKESGLVCRKAEFKGYCRPVCDEKICRVDGDVRREIGLKNEIVRELIAVLFAYFGNLDREAANVLRMRADNYLVSLAVKAVYKVVKAGVEKVVILPRGCNKNSLFLVLGFFGGFVCGNHVVNKTVTALYYLLFLCSAGSFKGAYTDQDATLAYSSLLAQEHDADYSMFALSGQGICHGTRLVPDHYHYACKDKDSKNEYDFARKADIIVVNIGTNDETHSIDKNQFTSEFKKWIQFAKEANGEDCKFLAIWNMKNTNYYKLIKAVFDELGGEEAGYYIYKAKRSTNSGSSDQPSKAEHAAYVPDLVELCKKILATPITSTPETDAPATPGTDTTAVALPANTVAMGEIFYDYKDGQEATFTFGGVAYKATVGKDAFAMFMDAAEAAPADGTIFLLPGTYLDDFKFEKNLTVLGPKAGIDPNVKGATQIDDWTLNPQRGEDEAIIMGNIGPGVYNQEVFPDCNKVVIDGVQFSGGFLFRYNSGMEGNSRLELKNILVKDVTTTNQMFFFYPYYPKDMTSSSYVRDVLIENIRIEGLISKSLFRMCAENLEVKGMYVDAASTQAMIGEHTGILGVVGTEGTDKWTFKDCMFKNTSTTIFRFDLTSSAGTQPHLTNLGANKKLEVEINNCVFAGDHLTGEHPAWITIIRDNQAVTLRVKDNVFISNGSNSPIISDEGSATGAYAAITEISGNIVTGTNGAYKFSAATDAATFVK